jgi:hypothetical protein
MHLNCPPNRKVAQRNPTSQRTEHTARCKARGQQPLQRLAAPKIQPAFGLAGPQRPSPLPQSVERHSRMFLSALLIFQPSVSGGFDTDRVEWGSSNGLVPPQGWSDRAA